MYKRFVSLLIIMLISATVYVAEAAKFTLVIDAGHGGNDIGAPGKISNEEDINLTVALAFGQYVERNCNDVNVVYTRKTDKFIPLYQRADIANKAKADLFVSIHTNALDNGVIARGIETYTLGDGRSNATKTNLEVAKRENAVILQEDDYQQHYVGYDPNSPELDIMFEFMHDKYMANSIDFAKMVQHYVCREAKRPDKSVHQSNFAVLRLTSMPACLVELGFITTPDEEELLNDKKHVDDIARGLYQAFVQYKSKYDSNITAPYKAPENDKIDIPQVVPDEYKPQKKAEEQIRVTSQSEDKPIFKVQILTSARKIPAGSEQFKGLDNVESYTDAGSIKYTYGASADYNEINRLYKQVVDKFSDAFIVAFKNDVRMDIRQAINEFKNNKTNK